MNEKINNAAPSQAPEVIIPEKRRGLYSVDDKTEKQPEKVTVADSI